MKKLYLIRGASGAGKSSFVEAMMEDKPHAIAFSSDDWMIKQGEYTWDKRRAGITHMICLNQTEKHMNPKGGVGGWQDIFIHNTFTTKAELKPYYELAKKCG